MVNVRRAARELALKALFQEDVGNQPPGDAIDGVLAQIASSVVAPMHQVSREAQTQLQQAASDLLAGKSPHTGRNTRRAATLCANEIRSLEARLFGVTRGELSEPPTVAAHEVEGAIATAQAATGERLLRIASRAAPYPDHLEALTALAAQKANLMVASLRRFRQPALSTARLTRALVDGVHDHQAEIDARLEELATGWRLDRQPAVDRNIMRIAACEIMAMPSVPAVTSINEAVELARKYSTAESGRFVHGVLSALAHAAGASTTPDAAVRPTGADEPGHEEAIAIPDEPDENGPAVGDVPPGEDAEDADGADENDAPEERA